jgi:hypothetical protein
MSKRLNKRQQRELEELRELESAKVELQSSAQAEVSESEEEQVAEPVKKKFNPFDAVSYHLNLCPWASQDLLIVIPSQLTEGEADVVELEESEEEEKATPVKVSHLRDAR